MPSINQGNTCDFCGTDLIDLGLKYPHWSTELRPIFPPECDFLQDLIGTSYGYKFANQILPRNVLCFWNDNSRGGFRGRILRRSDYLMEISFSSQNNDWIVMPTLASLKYSRPEQGILHVREPYQIDMLVGSKILVGWIEETDFKYTKGMFIFVNSGSVWAIGKVLRNDINCSENEPLIAIVEKGTYVEDVQFTDRELTFEMQMESFVKMNSRLIDQLADSAISDIREFTKNNHKEIAVSFSGGKDSTVILLLALLAIPKEKLHLIFIDTGIEFPETRILVDDIAEALDLQDQLHIAKAERDFFDLWDFFGPPSTASRWCCKTQKFSPLNSLIKSQFPNGLLTIAGVRSQESKIRKWSDKQEHNKWVEKQDLLYIIKDWSLLEVWIYILHMKNKLQEEGIDLPINPLYYSGMTRVGCWACPMISPGVFKIQERIASNLMNRLKDKLNTYRMKLDKPKEWVDEMLWRTDSEVNKIESIPICTMNTNLVFNNLKNGNNLREFLKILGHVKSSKLGITISTSTKERVILTKSNTLSIPKSLFNEKVHRLILKGLACVGCGLCVDSCPSGCLDLVKNKLTVNDDCIHCGKCIDFPCPALDKYSPISFGDIS